MAGLSRLGVVLGACAALLVGLLVAWSGDDGPQLAANWSAWQPDTSRMVDGAVAIAAHIGRQYELVRVDPSSLEQEDLGVAVRPQGAARQVLEGEGLVYTLETAGDPPDLLLRREALELALYSFRYLDDVTMVAVLLPPDGESRRAVFFRPGDLLPQLQVPLGATLADRTVRRLVRRNEFLASRQELEPGQDYLLLAEPDTTE